MRPALITICLILVVVGSVFTLVFRHRELVVEDGPIELVGALGFFTASMVMGARLFLQFQTLTIIGKSFIGFVSVFSLLLFLSEMSFGSRLGWVSPPEMYGGGEFDGGHDIFVLTLRILKDSDTSLRLLAAVAVAGLLISTLLFGWTFRAAVLGSLRDMVLHPFSFRMACAFAMLASAVVLDALGSVRISILEEAVEFVASGVLFAASVTALPKILERARSVPVA